jgi:hypothetical protein
LAMSHTHYCDSFNKCKNAKFTWKHSCLNAGYLSRAPFKREQNRFRDFREILERRTG